jgi:hypothetical protein
MQTGLQCTSRHNFSASKVIEYVHLRLSAEKDSCSDTQLKTSTGVDEMLEHMRCRLKATSPQQALRNPKQTLAHHYRLTSDQIRKC